MSGDESPLGGSDQSKSRGVTKYHYIVGAIVLVLVVYGGLAIQKINNSSDRYSPMSEVEMSITAPLDFIFYSMKGSIMVSSVVTGEESIMSSVNYVSDMQISVHYRYYRLFSKIKKQPPVGFESWQSVVKGSFVKMRIYSDKQMSVVLGFAKR